MSGLFVINTIIHWWVLVVMRFSRRNLRHFSSQSRDKPNIVTMDQRDPTTVTMDQHDPTAESILMDVGLEKGFEPPFINIYISFFIFYRVSVFLIK